MASLGRGSGQTLTSDVYDKLNANAKHAMARTFKRKSEEFSTDLDAFSFSIMVRGDMDSTKKQAIKTYLFSAFGSSTSACSLPRSNPGSNKNHSMFGSKCMHLPDDLDSEMLVLNTPIKIGMHSSCRQNIVEYMNEKGCFLQAASPKSLLCFDPNAAANIPTFGVWIDAIISCCKVTQEGSNPDNSKNHIIHIGEMGQKLESEKLSDISNLFNVKPMRDLGIIVEIIQVDFAWEFGTPSNGQFIQASRINRTNNKKSVLTESQARTYPIHPQPMTKKRRPNEDDDDEISCKNVDLLGSIEVKKGRNWEQKDKEVHFLLFETDDDRHEKLLMIYSYPGGSGGSRYIRVCRVSIFSVKAYSTLIHTFNQTRHLFPFTLDDFVHLPRKTFQQLQTILDNCRTKFEWAKSIVNNHGIKFRVEVSIRPHFKDPLRTEGHVNDILFHACLAVKDFCKECKPKVQFLHMAPVVTKAMELMNVLEPKLRRRHKSVFSSHYDGTANGNGKHSDWLRSHMTHLLFVMGICPQIGVKYYQDWLEDNNRWSPYERTERNDETGRLQDTIARQNIKSFQRSLEEMNFSERAIKSLVAYAKANNWDPKACFMALSLRSKIRLTAKLPDILHHITRLRQSSRKRQRSSGHSNDPPMCENPSLREVLDYSVSPNSEDQLMDKFEQLGRLWYEDETGYNALLFTFIIKCHHSEEMTWYRRETIDPSKHIGSLIHDWATGGTIRHKEVKKVCSALSVVAPRTTQKIQDFIKLLAIHYRFPPHWALGELLDYIEHLGLGDQRGYILRAIGKCIDDTFTSDIVILVNSGNISRELTYFRTLERRKISIPLPDHVWSQTDSPLKPKYVSRQQDVYSIVAKHLNTDPKTLRAMLKDRLSLSDHLDEYFLTQTGSIYPEMFGSKTLEQLERSQNFNLVSKTNSWGDYFQGYHRSPPCVILPLVCLVYEKHAAYLDMQKNTSLFMIYHSSLVVTYKGSSARCRPLMNTSLIVTKNTQGVFELNQTLPQRRPGSDTRDNFTIETHFGRLQTVPRLSDVPGSRRSRQSFYDNFTIEKHFGRLQTVSRLSDVPGSRRSRQSFYGAARQLLELLDQNYIEGDNDDNLGLISYTRELSSSPENNHSCFDNRVMENCPLLRRPFRSIADIIEGKGQDGLSHQFLCPIICLKHTLVIVVIEKQEGGDRKMSYLYAFDQRLDQVTCHLCSGIQLLRDRSEALYFYSSSSTSTSYYLPSNISQGHHNSIKGKFSHLGPLALGKCYETIIQLFQMNHDRQTLIRHNVRVTDLRPRSGHSGIIPVHIVSESWRFPHLSQLGVTHNALALIFSENEANEEWNACVVHHPLQDLRDVRRVLVQLFGEAEQHGTYHYHTIKGVGPEICESGYLMILYAVIGFHVSTLNHFQDVMQRVQTEDRLLYKLRSWIYGLRAPSNNRDPLSPTWLAQLVQSEII